MQEVLDLDAEVCAVPQERKVKAGGRNLTVRAATGEAARQYRQASLVAGQWAVDEERGIRKLANPTDLIDLEPLLVSLCAFEEGDRRVSKTWVMSLAPELQVKLHAVAKSLNPWLDGDSDADLEELRERRGRIDRLILKLEAAKAHPNGSAEATSGS